MLPFTKQEKTAVLFLAAAVLFGSLFMLLEKRYPPVFRLVCPALRSLLQEKINIHTATQEEWESLPGIGTYRASMIVAERERRGRFSSIEDVRYVKGIGPRVFEQIRGYLGEE